MDSNSAILIRALSFAGLPRVTLEEPALIVQALEWSAAGMDFADALHLGRAEDRGDFVTFDRRLIKAARAAGRGNLRAP